MAGCLKSNRETNCQTLACLAGSRGAPARLQHRKTRLRTSTDVLEELLERTTLMTQRVTHLHILALGDELQRRRVKKPRGAPLEVSEALETEEDDDDAICRLEEALQALGAKAEEEKQAALREQNQALQQVMEEIARNRDHLEEERLGLLHWKLEQEKETALQEQKEWADLEQRMAIESACAGLRQRVLLEAEQMRRQEVERVVAAVTKAFEKRLEEVIEKTRADCLNLAEEERRRLNHLHALEVKALQDRIELLEQEVTKVLREKMEYEKEFKEVQLNYKRFIDLTESSLHSDYLLRLRHLGKPPGHADEEVQTDLIVITAKRPIRK